MVGWLVKRPSPKTARVSDVSATRAVRSHRYPPPDCSKPIRYGFLLSDYDYGTPRNWARLGLSISGRHGGASACCPKAGRNLSTPAPVEDAGLRRPVLGEWRRCLADPEDVVLHERRRRSAGGHHPHTRSRRCPHGPPPRRPRWDERFESGARRAAAGSPITKSLKPPNH